MSAGKVICVVAWIALTVPACGASNGGAGSNAVTGPADATTAQLNAINDAELAAPASPAAVATPAQPDPAVIKAEVLLARAHASPGVIDGLAGSNLAQAVAAFEQMNGLPPDGQLTAAVWMRLASGPQAPVAALYMETSADVAGPFYPDVGENLVAASKLPALGYSEPAEALAARFHMSEALLKELNPGANFAQAGTTLVAVQPAVDPLPAVDHIQVDKAAASVRAYDSQGAIVASFPATVGSVERPSPEGVHEIKGVSYNPTYTYNPTKLTWGPKSHGKFTIQPGPNNPVGLVWIALNAPGYGIHGSPHPDKIGKTASHGCVRLTNWDALLLADAVKPGVQVVFLNQRPG